MVLDAQQMSRTIRNIAFVCFANVCRSPAMQAVFQRLVNEAKLEEEFYIDSFALASHAIGQGVSPMMNRVLYAHGIEFEHEAQTIEEYHFKLFDLVCVATKDIGEALKKRFSYQWDERIQLLTAYSKLYKDEDIIDPYLGGEEEFNRAYVMIEESCIELFHAIC